MVAARQLDRLQQPDGAELLQPRVVDVDVLESLADLFTR
jgi:hypothetical protein